MKNKDQLLNKENWIQYLNIADDGGLTNNAKANDIVSKIKEAINYSRCCKSESEQLKCECCGFEYERKDLDYAPNGDLVCEDCTF